MNAAIPAVHVRRSDVELFLIHEARLLDERRFDEWMNLFMADGYYWVPARQGQPDPWNEVSLMFDDREIMENRISRLKHPKIYAQLPPSRATRQVSNVSIEASDENDAVLTIRSVLFIHEFRPTLPSGIERIFSAACSHRLHRDGETFRIAWKKVELTNCDASFDPIFLYF